MDLSFLNINFHKHPQIPCINIESNKEKLRKYLRMLSDQIKTKKKKRDEDRFVETSNVHQWSWTSNFGCELEEFLVIFCARFLNQACSPNFVDCVEIESSSNEALLKEKIRLKEGCRASLFCKIFPEKNSSFLYFSFFSLSLSFCRYLLLPYPSRNALVPFK